MRPPEPPAFPGGGRYHRLGPALVRRFGGRVWRLVLDGGFGCPNRDGRLGRGGCAFCSPAAYRRAGPGPLDLAGQLERGLQDLRRRRRAARAVAYFQAGTATDAPLPDLEALYSTALAEPAVVALAIGTRPDCVPEPVLALTAGLVRRTGKPIWLDLGLQLADDALLASLGRGHSVQAFEDTALRARAAGLEVVAHVILDLPGAEDVHRRATATCLNRVGVAGVKLHNLHVLRGTPLADRLAAGQLRLAAREEYVQQACSFLTWLDPSIVVHRLTGEAPRELLAGPAWCMEKSLIIQSIANSLRSAGTFQGAERLAEAPGAPRIVP